MAKSESIIFKELRDLKTSTAAAALIPRFAQERMLTQQKLDTLENSREDAILSGPSAREKLRVEVEEIKGYLDDLDAGTRVAERLLKEFREKEFRANLEAESAVVRTLADEAFAANTDFIKFMLKAATARQNYLEKIKRVQTFRQELSKAGRADLSPPDDPIVQAFKKAGRQWQNPIHNHIYDAPLNQIPHVGAALKEVGYEL